MYDKNINKVKVLQPSPNIVEYYIIDIFIHHKMIVAKKLQSTNKENTL